MAPDIICYWVEEIDEECGQLMLDVSVAGRVELSTSVGSPAPLTVVREFEHTVRITTPKS